MYTTTLALADIVKCLDWDQRGQAADGVEMSGDYTIMTHPRAALFSVFAVDHSSWQKARSGGPDPPRASLAEVIDDQTVGVV